MVRGAPIGVSILRSNARKCWKLHHYFGISMFALPGRDAVEVACEVGIPHDEICEARVGAIRAEGFELKRTGNRRGHFSLVFADKPSGKTLQTVVVLFAICQTTHVRGVIDMLRFLTDFNEIEEDNYIWADVEDAEVFFERDLQVGRTAELTDGVSHWCVGVITAVDLDRGLVRLLIDWQTWRSTRHPRRELKFSPERGVELSREWVKAT